MLFLKGISKSYGAIPALQNVDFSLRTGEVHALFGENGAGKSTLINIIAGTLRPDTGQRLFHDKDITKYSVHATRQAGIVPIFQEFSLIPSLTVEENIFLGREEIVRGGWLSRKSMQKKAQSLLDMLGFSIDVNASVGNLSRAQQQMTEIAKALLDSPELLILDEPTASLTEAETEKLFAVIGRLRTEGVGIIYVSHRLPEIKQLSNRITVLRNGMNVATVATIEASDNTLIEWVTGKKIDSRYPSIKHTPKGTALRTELLSLTNGRVKGASITLRFGEVVGIAGLVGCGKSDIVRACFGLSAPKGGYVELYGKRHNRPTPRTMLRAGLCYFPSDRNNEGLALTRPIKENASMAALDITAISSFGRLKTSREHDLVSGVLQKLRLRASSINANVSTLSGGNRQKVLLSRGLIRDINIFLFDEPTVGIDVGAKYEIYELIGQLVEGGAAVLLVSSELPEITNLCNRVYVMHDGRITAELAGPDLQEQSILPYFFGRQDEATRKTT